MDAPVLHILIDEDGVPRTINKRVKVHMITEKHMYGKLSADEIAEHYSITVADVYAALAYYHDNYEYYEEREAQVKPILEEAKRYTIELNKKIEVRLAEKKSDD